MGRPKRTKKEIERIPIQAERLRQLISEKKTSQRKLAKEIGCSQSLLSQIEKYEKPMTKDKAEKIHQLYSDISVDWLMAEDYAIIEKMKSILSMNYRKPPKELKPTVPMLTCQNLLKKYGYSYVFSFFKEQDDIQVLSFNGEKIKVSKSGLTQLTTDICQDMGNLSVSFNGKVIYPSIDFFVRNSELFPEYESFVHSRIKSIQK